MTTTGGIGTGVEWSADGQWLAYLRQGKLFRIPRNGGPWVPLPTGSHVPSALRVSRDGRSIYYSVVSGPPLEGRRGTLGYYFAADARYLYVIWREDDSAIWTMDAGAKESR